MNVPGKTRWVTTSIARFDPDIDWPSDLDFSVVVRPIKTYDGKTIESSSQDYTTLSQSMYLSTVTSKKASLLTDNQWSATVEKLEADLTTISSNLHEVPPDGEIQLTFGSKIDVELVGPSLKIQEIDSSHTIPFTYRECPGNCIILVPSKQLSTDVNYRIVLPASTRTYRYAGFTRNALNTSPVSGLYPFRFPFKQIYSPGPSHRVYNLFLRHGLRSGDEDALKNSIEITPELPFTLTFPSKAIVSLHAAFMDNTSYVITVHANPNILDGYDLPLQTSRASFTTSEREHFVTQAEIGQLSGAFETFNHSWKIYSRDAPSFGGCTSRVLTVNVNLDNIKSAIASTLNYESSVLAKQATKYEIQTTGNLLDTTSIPTADLFGTTGIWLKETFLCNEYSSYVSKSSNFVSMNTFTLISIQGNNAITFWATRSDGANKSSIVVPNANIIIYGAQTTMNPTADDIIQLASLQTDSNGLATYNFGNIDWYNIYPVLVVGNTIHIGDSHYIDGNYYNPSYLTLVSSVFTDRGFYKPGDTVYIKGYMRFRDNQQRLSIPDQKSWTSGITWKRTDSEQTNYPITLTSRGTFELTLNIPTDADSGSKSMNIRPVNQWDHSTYVEILVSEPRVPTTVLTISSTEKIRRPGKTTPVSVSLNTYTGTPIANALVKIRWTLSRNKPSFWLSDFVYGWKAIMPESTTTALSDEQGELEVTTDENGVSDFDLVLGNVTEEEGNQLIVTAEYFSPTKEILEEKLTLNVAYSKYSLSLKTTVEGDILPGYKFGVFASVMDVTTESEMENIPVIVNIYEWNGQLPEIDRTTGLIDFGDKASVQTSQKCKFLSTKGGSNIGCNFQLPFISKYLLVASIVDDQDYFVTSLLSVGKSIDEWAKKPLSSWNGISMVLDKSKYNIGETAHLEFMNPFPTALVLLRWGNAPNSQVRIEEISAGITELNITIGQECYGGCNFDLILSKPRSIGVEAPSVPTSILFDHNAATIITRNFFINVENEKKNIDVAITVDKEILEPGDQSSFYVQITKDGSPVSGEVAVFIVDKAVLDLKEHPIPRYNESLSYFSLAQYFSISHDSKNWISDEGYIEASKILARRFKADPWFNGKWSTVPTSCLDQLDQTDEEYFERFSHAITYGASSTSDFDRHFCDSVIFYAAMERKSFGGLAKVSFKSAGVSTASFAAAEFSMDSAAEGAAAPLAARNSLVADSTAQSAPPATATTIRSYKDFVTTPVFKGTINVDSSGKTKLTWKLPSNVGTFEIRALAIDDNHNFGAATKSQISRRQFSVQPSLPRIVRVGDSFEAGITVSISDKTFNDRLTIQIDRVCELLTLSGQPTQTVSVKGSGPHSVNFKFLALGTGEAEVLFKVFHGEDMVDAALYTIDIRGQQEPVFIATSMAVSESHPANEGWKLPASLPYSGNFTLDVGVGRLPAVNYFANIAYQRMASYLPSSDDLICAMTPHVALSKYNIRTHAPYFQNALSLLESYHDPNHGLQYYPLSFTTYRYVNVRLLSYAVFLFNNTHDVSTPEQKQNIISKIDTWTNIMYQELLAQASRAREYGTTFSDFNGLAFFYLAVGAKYPVSDKDITFKRLMENLSTLNMASRAAVSYCLERDFENDPILPDLIQDMTNAIRTQGRTAYISERRESYSDANPSITGSALGLQVFIKTRQPITLVEKIANFAAQESNDHLTKFWRWWRFSGEQVTHLMLALANYDDAVQNTEPNLDVQVVSDTEESVLSKVFTSPSDAPVHKEMYFEEMPGQELLFSATGDGEASVVFGARFTPAEINLQPIFRGIQVNKTIQYLDPFTNAAVGGPLNQAQLGRRVITTIQIYVPDYASSIHIIDPFPGALEPMDDNIYDSAATTSSDGFSGSRWWWYMNSFSQKEFKKDKVIFYGQSVSAGTHTVTYVSLVNTKGEFVLPPALAYDSFQPEVMGLSAGGKFGIKDWKDNLNLNSTYCLQWENRKLVDGSIPGLVTTPSTGASLLDVETNYGDDLTLALGIGLAAGVVFLFAVGGGVGYLLWKKRNVIEHEKLVDDTQHE
eukprot:TRINITY_DN10363_c0_g1_i1.p1 TRINITY_DN10363_c0_g1~~TRINITY_DN10363_c0_g1_i1.p1  ORF type:complete len:2120 (-),score=451.00 TRINITY_DN10363_c0_g1_i1:124-6228(-)